MKLKILRLNHSEQLIKIDSFALYFLLSVFNFPVLITCFMKLSLFSIVVKLCCFPGKNIRTFHIIKTETNVIFTVKRE